jgi:DNA replication protein DnaC
MLQLRLTMNQDLSPQRAQELANLAQAAEQAKRKAAQAAKARLNGRTPHKEEVSDLEYQKRLRQSLKRDQTIVTDTKDARIKKSLENWKAKVGPTFREATTDHPVILDRVSRLQDPNGKHLTSVAMYGNLGVGKTWLGNAYINLAIASGAVTDGQIISDTETSVLGRIAKGGYKAPEMLEELFNPRYKIYFIDDVGQGFFSNEHGRTEVWYELVDHIYTHQLTLILTTNKEFTDRSLGGWIGMRAFDRLKTLVGRGGLIEPSKVNKRESVLEAREERYRG